MKKYRLNRDVTPTECRWLTATVMQGTVVYHYAKPTYGCITPNGTAVTFEDRPDAKFVELPTATLDAFSRFTLVEGDRPPRYLKGTWEDVKRYVRDEFDVRPSEFRSVKARVTFTDVVEFTIGSRTIRVTRADEIPNDSLSIVSVTDELAKLHAAIKDAGFAVMKTSGAWSIHDVSERGKADDAKSLQVANKNIELSIRNRELEGSFRSLVNALHGYSMCASLRPAYDRALNILGMKSKSHPIPPITDPMGKHWSQPDRSLIAVDAKVARMSTNTLRQLSEHSVCAPSHPCNGKMWRLWHDGAWYLNWYESCANIAHVIQQRKIILTDENP